MLAKAPMPLTPSALTYRGDSKNTILVMSKSSTPKQWCYDVLVDYVVEFSVREEMILLPIGNRKSY
jgi:hypothetical protein